MQKYRSPAIELYGAEGVLQMLGDDWAPEGFEQWSNARGSWEVVPESDPQWPWTDGLRHLVDAADRGLPTVTRPEHAYHALEVMLAAKRSAAEGRVISIESEFPALDYSAWDFSADDAPPQARPEVELNARRAGWRSQPASCGGPRPRRTRSRAAGTPTAAVRASGTTTAACPATC